MAYTDASQLFFRSLSERTMHRNRPIRLVLAILLLIAFNPAPAQTSFGQEKAIDVLGQRIHSVEAGSGPAVVLLHSLSWKPLWCAVLWCAWEDWRHPNVRIRRDTEALFCQSWL